MKKLLLPLIAVLAFLALGAADSSPTVTISMLGCNPTWNDDGSLATCSVQALFQTSMAYDDQKLVGQTSVSWDGTDQKKTVTYNGNTYTYYEATMVVAAIANQERLAQAQLTATLKAEAVATAKATAIKASPSP